MGTGVQLALLVLSVILITIAGACPWLAGQLAGGRVGWRGGGQFGPGL